MFCPKCGEELILQDAEVVCVRGEMALSRTVAKVLGDRFAAIAAAQSTEPPYNPQWHDGLHWFCPGCGNPLNRHLECPSCGKHLRDLVPTLIELHPHQRTAEGR